jgi:hypothetical protein
MGTQVTRMLVLGAALAAAGCGSDGGETSSSGEIGGSAGTGGAPVTGTGGNSGSATGGELPTPTGGSATGGADTGGSATGGADTGGSATGGADTGGSATGGADTGGSATGGASGQPAAFELEGSWLYLGPWDGEHTLAFSGASAVYASITGDWSSSWSLTEYDNDLHQFQLAFETGTGTYYPTGATLRGSYDLNTAILTVQLADGSGPYPPLESPGSCTDAGGERIVDCRLYLRQ